MSFVLWPLFWIAMVGATLMVIHRLQTYRAIGPDRRYLELPPGTLPADNPAPTSHPAPVGPVSADVQLPVRFEPPDISVAAAGLLSSGRVRGRDLAATLVELQRRRLVSIDESAPHHYLLRATGAEPDQPGDVAEEALLARLFRHGDRGPVDLADRDVLADAAEAYASAVVRTAISRDWFIALPDPHDRLAWAIPLVLAGAVSAAEILLFDTIAIGPALFTVGGVNWLTRGRFRRGSRTADGRAMADQLDGFRHYLRTAETDQLRFEADADLYARYLPWAVSFDIADRWSAVCQQALRTDELPDFRLPPTWMLHAFFRIPRDLPE